MKIFLGIDTMQNYCLIYPMFTMVLLTFVILILMFRTRTRSVASGAVKASYYKTYQGDAEPEAAQKLTRHFSNLFEAPTLYYVACLAGLTMHVNDLAFLILAWAYVFARVIHAYIHLGKNKIYPRIYAYFSSWLILLAMWAYLALRAGVVI